MNSLPKTVTRQRRGCDLNPGPSAPESNTLTTRLPSHATSGYYTALSYDVIRNVFLSFTFASAKVEEIWFESLVSAKDKVVDSILPPSL